MESCVTGMAMAVMMKMHRCARLSHLNHEDGIKKSHCVIEES